MKILKGSRQLAVISLAVLIVWLGPLSWSLAETSPPLEEWSRTFRGSNVHNGLTVQATSDGRYIITGITLSFGAEGTNVFLVNMESLGSERKENPLTPSQAPPVLPHILSNLGMTSPETPRGYEAKTYLDIGNIKGRSFTHTVNKTIDELKLLIDVELEAYVSTTVSGTKTQDSPGDDNVTADGLTGNSTISVEPEPEPEPEAEPEKAPMAILVNVFDEDQVLLSGVKVFSTTQPEGQSTLDDTTSSDGEVTFRDVIAGEYVIKAMIEGYESATSTGGVTLGDTLELVFYLEETETEPEKRGIPRFYYSFIVLGLVIMLIKYNKKRL